jgi:hypothetical protein
MTDDHATRFGRYVLSALSDHGATPLDAMQAAALAVAMQEQKREREAAVAILDAALAQGQPLYDACLSLTGAALSQSDPTLDERRRGVRPWSRSGVIDAPSWQFLARLAGVPAPEAEQVTPDLLLTGQGDGPASGMGDTGREPVKNARTLKIKRGGRSRRRLGRHLRLPQHWQGLSRP